MDRDTDSEASRWVVTWPDEFEHVLAVTAAAVVLVLAAMRPGPLVSVRASWWDEDLVMGGERDWEDVAVEG